MSGVERENRFFPPLFFFKDGKMLSLVEGTGAVVSPESFIRTFEMILSPEFNIDHWLKEEIVKKMRKQSQKRYGYWDTLKKRMVLLDEQPKCVESYQQLFVLEIQNEEDGYSRIRFEMEGRFRIEVSYYNLVFNVSPYERQRRPSEFEYRDYTMQYF